MPAILVGSRPTAFAPRAEVEAYLARMRALPAEVPNRDRLIADAERLLALHGEFAASEGRD